MPELPTIGEFYPGYEVLIWHGLFAPAGTPQPILETLNAAFAKAATTPEMEEAFHKGGMLPTAQASLADAHAWITAQMAGWRRVVDELQIVVDE